MLLRIEHPDLTGRSSVHDRRIAEWITVWRGYINPCTEDWKDWKDSVKEGKESSRDQSGISQPAVSRPLNGPSLLSPP